MHKKRQDQLTRLREQNGFTLVELLVVLVISAIALAIAIPSFNHLIISNRIAGTANAYVNAIDQARLEAIKRNRQTQVCSNSAGGNTTDTLGTQCGIALGAVYVIDPGGTTTSKIQNALTLPAGIQVSDGSNSTHAVVALRYSGEGLAIDADGSSDGNGDGPYSGLVADVYSKQIRTDNHRCLYLTTGSILSSCTITSNTNGGCPTSEPKPCQQ